MTGVVCTYSGCDRPCRPTATLCGAHVGQLERHLREVPTLLADLTDARGGRVRLTAGGGGRHGGEDWVPRWSDDARRAEESLVATLVRWYAQLLTSEPAPPVMVGHVTQLAGWLLDRVDRIAQHDLGGAAAVEVIDACRAAWRAVDRPADRWFAGPCTATADCVQDLYARLGAVRVVCPVCGAGYDLVERREWLLQAAEDQLRTATELTRALPVLGVPIGTSTIRVWVSRGRLVQHGVDAFSGHPLYRVGDVLTLAAAAPRNDAGAAV